LTCRQRSVLPHKRTRARSHDSLALTAPEGTSFMLAIAAAATVALVMSVYGHELKSLT
jgi:hypothetical protein